MMFYNAYDNVWCWLWWWFFAEFNLMIWWWLLLNMTCELWGECISFGDDYLMNVWW